MAKPRVVYKKITPPTPPPKKVPKPEKTITPKGAPWKATPGKKSPLR